MAGRGGSFTASINAFIAKANGNVDRVVREVCLSLAYGVVMRSPVDTGRFRGNWQFAIASAPMGTKSDTDKSGADTLGRAKAASAQMAGGAKFYIINNLPYGPRLEFDAWSRQAPQGMVRITVLEFIDHVKRAAQELR
jgi:hypothetical protein